MFLHWLAIHRARRNLLQFRLISLALCPQKTQPLFLYIPHKKPSFKPINDHFIVSDIQGLPRSASDRDQIVYSTVRSESITSKTDRDHELVAKLGIIYANACHASLCTTALDCLSVSCHCRCTALTTIYKHGTGRGRW